MTPSARPRPAPSSPSYDYRWDDRRDDRRDDSRRDSRRDDRRPDRRRDDRRRDRWRDDRPDSRRDDRRDSRRDSRWDTSWGEPRDDPRAVEYDRAHSVGQGSGFTLSSLSTANLRKLGPDDYDNVPVTNGPPYVDNDNRAHSPFVTKNNRNRNQQAARSRHDTPSSAQQNEQDHRDWSPAARSDAQEEISSDQEWQARRYPAVKRTPAPDLRPATEATGVRTESEKSKTGVTVVPNEPMVPPRQASVPVPPPTHEVITEPLSPVTGKLSPLAVGELLHKRRYVIVSLMEQQATQNLYLVKDRLLRRCMACGEDGNQKDELECRTCGREWLKEAVEHPRYLLRETFDQQKVEQLAAIVPLQLRHANITPLLHTFSDQPYGAQPRFYLLSEAHEGLSLASLSAAQAGGEAQVLSWGRQLADGLMYLHGQGVMYQPLGLEQVVLVQGQAKLSDLSHAQQVPEYAPAAWQANEVDALGDMLFKLLDPLALSSPTTALFERFAHSQDRFLTMQAFADALDETLQLLHENVKVTHLVGQSTHIGQQRILNEDHLLTLKFEHAYLSQSKPIGLYLVADGIGGQAAGEVASQLAVSTITQLITSKVMLHALSSANANPEEAEPAPPDYAALLKEACLSANELLHEHRLQANNDMGTTMVAALVVDHHAYIANVGDSRAYFIHQGQMSQLTSDHSLVGRLLSLGQITPEQARTHPQRHVIYRTLGNNPQVEIDIFEQKMQPGDALVLCTDGLYDMVKESLIQQQAMHATHPQAACEELVLLANQAGGEDNIAVIVIKVEEVG